jgi:tetratricopeptide (TPR) repeat protein
VEIRFAEARAAFDAQDFVKAQLLYEQCIALGMQGPAIHYNIGVSAYRSGDLARAESAFREVARTPAMAPLAYYNLGLVALKRSDPKRARGWFERAARESTDEKLTALAARRLEEFPSAPAAAPWSIYARGGVGYDDNVALRSESINTPGSGEDDSFAEFMAAGSYFFLPSWHFDAAAGLFRYSSLDEFDQTALSLGVTRDLNAGGWHLELGGHGTQLSLGGDVYERSIAAAAQASRTFTGYGTVRAQARFSAVDGEGDFSGLTGDRTELGAQYEWAWRSLGFVTHARAEFNDCENEAFASRWVELGGEVRWGISPLWAVNAGARLRRTRHPAQEIQDAFDDDRVAVRIEATRSLWKQAQLYLRYEHERNDSPVDLYRYDRNWVAASIEIWH